jgi:hypothetical protein
MRRLDKLIEIDWEFRSLDYEFWLGRRAVIARLDRAIQ